MSNILISGGFKTSTTTLSKTFKNSIKTHYLPYIYKNKNPDKYKNINIIIIPFRINDEVFKSAFFQDIIEGNYYDYSPFYVNNFLHKYNHLDSREKKKIINKIDVNELINFYKIIDWEKYLHLNNITRIDLINKEYNINIDYNLDKLQIFILPDKKKIISFNIKNLNSIFKDLVYNIYGYDKNILIKNDNIGKNKWYKNKYLEFLQKFN
jgi:hypothetical protein